MIDIKLTTEKLLTIPVQSYAFFLEEHGNADLLAELAKTMFAPLQDLIKERGFTASAGSYFELSAIQNNRPVTLLLLGIGAKKNGICSLESYRRAVGRLVRFTESHRLKTVGMSLPDGALFGITTDRLAQETATILHKASYHFDEFITNEAHKLHFASMIHLSVLKAREKEVQAGIDKGILIAEAINSARYWCDLPPCVLTPTKLANEAASLAQKRGLKSTIFTQEEIRKMGMGGIIGVSQGSIQECRLAILEYKAARADAPTIALVGKGVTFDSGGISIKPSLGMETMKDDMAGAAVVIATLGVIGALKPDVNVIGLAPLVENMPSGTATKPGDILRFYNGKTAEVQNTDAEGRLILADALSYAVANYKLDAIIDIATLTGACAAALGHFYCGLLSQDDTLVARLNKASASSGDRVWRLPMDNDYKPAIKSDVADMCNIGSPKYKAGAITVAFFLNNFVDNVPWAHLDIAGTAFGVPDLTYLRPGATGFGIRLFVDLLLNWQHNNGRH